MTSPKNPFVINTAPTLDDLYWNQIVNSAPYQSTIKEAGMPAKKASNILQGLVLGYSDFSKGGKAVADALGCAFVGRQNLGYSVMNTYGTIGAVEGTLPPDKPKIKYIINWGCAPAENKNKGHTFQQYPDMTEKLINPFKAVAICANKKLFFQAMSVSDGPRIPEFTTDLKTAQDWALSGLVVLGRKEHGSAGKDVAFFEEKPEKFLGSDLWLQYKKKKQEYRIHIMGGEVLMMQQKVLPTTDPEGKPIPRDSVDFRIRTHRTGFVFKKQDVNPPADVLKQANKAFKILAAKGLDFGAIDVIYNKAEDQAYVLECNTAPGLEETSISTYADGLKKLLSL